MSEKELASALVRQGLAYVPVVGGVLSSLWSAVTSLFNLPGPVRPGHMFDQQYMGDLSEADWRKAQVQKAQLAYTAIAVRIFQAVHSAYPTKSKEQVLAITKQVLRRMARTGLTTWALPPVSRTGAMVNPGARFFDVGLKMFGGG